ncbi:MAG TPA: hypothetical protein DIW54_14570 [Chitinophagaceae bacterium]|nr:hypothetical protein [Chitinophagaceae bacterium]
MAKLFIYILFLFSLTLSQSLFGQKLIDTTFLLKQGDHSIFIDSSPKSKFYDNVSDFHFGKFDGDSYKYSLQYLKDNRIKLTKHNIIDLPKKWVIIKYYKNKFYAYHPSDFYSHFKVSITDTAFIDFGGEGPMANKILSYKKINEKTFSFSLTGVERPKRKLTIHIVDKMNNIAIFEELYNDKDKLYYLMVDAAKIRNLPIIVNYCKSQKQMEFDFDEPDYAKLINSQ